METPEEMMSRLRQMSSGSSETWDLSPNDQAAIKYLIGLNESLVRDLAEIRSGADPTLQWDFNGEGEWTAWSQRIDGYDSYAYVIGVCDDGTFDVSESDSELLGIEKKPKRFPSLKEAKHYCEELESKI